MIVLCLTTPHYICTWQIYLFAKGATFVYILLPSTFVNLFFCRLDSIQCCLLIPLLHQPLFHHSLAAVPGPSGALLQRSNPTLTAAEKAMHKAASVQRKESQVTFNATIAKHLQHRPEIFWETAAKHTSRYPKLWWWLRPPPTIRRSTESLFKMQ